MRQSALGGLISGVLTAVAAWDLGVGFSEVDESIERGLFMTAICFAFRAGNAKSMLQTRSPAIDTIITLGELGSRYSKYSV